MAVKNVKLNIDSFFKNSLVSELEIKAQLQRHLNLVNLLGVCVESVNKGNYIYFYFKDFNKK